MVVVERTGPGTWRVGMKPIPSSAAVTWVGTAVASKIHCGLDFEGPWEVEPTVLLLLAARRSAVRLEHNTCRFQWPSEQRSAPATPWERSTAGKAKGAGRSLGEMAADRQKKQTDPGSGCG